MSLSDERISIPESELQKPLGKSFVSKEIFYLSQDVKDAVKELKNRRLDCYECGEQVTDDLIDEIFGEELTNDQMKGGNKT